MITRPFLCAIALMAISAAAYAAPTPMTPPEQMPAGTYQIDPAHASITWKVSHLGLSDYTARFTTFDATLTFDPTDPTRNSVTASIDPLSVRTDYPNADKKDFDKKLSTDKAWFNAGAFPEITFQSTKVQPTGKHTADVVGDLTLLGVTKPVTLAVTFNGAMAEQPFAKKPALGFSATTNIKRSEWGFDTYVPTIGDEVTIAIEAEFLRADTPADTAPTAQ